MPELPEVESYRRCLARHAQGYRVRQVTVADAAVLRNLTPEELNQAVMGRRFEDPERWGKWLLAPLEGPVVLFHFGMSGCLEWMESVSGPHAHDRVTFVLENGWLIYHDQRKLQGVWLASDREQGLSVMGPLGPDALTVGRSELEAILSRCRGLKAGLMDQERIAGLGNILSDEILWQARLHPERAGASLREREWDELHQALRYVLDRSVELGHVPNGPGWLTGQRDQPVPTCPRCGTALRRSRFHGRSSYWCPACQPKPERRECIPSHGHGAQREAARRPAG